MPPNTKMRTFIHALKTGKTDTMMVLDRIFKNPAYIADPAAEEEIRDLWTRLQDTNALETSLHNDANKALKKTLKKFGMVRKPEFKHIDEWPNGKWPVTATHPNMGKEAVRAALVHAVNNDRTVDFVWELYGELNETIEIDPSLQPDGSVVGNGIITVTFRSPRSKVKLHDTEDDVVVIVGEPDDE